MISQSPQNGERVGEPIPLTEATVQEIQLELLRSSSYNMMNGEQVVRDLMANRHLWKAVLFDRLPIFSTDYSPFSSLWLVKLRDLPTNIWNVDSLVILSDSIEKLRELERIATDDATHWNGEIELYDESHREQIDRTLGIGKRAAYLMAVWWH